MNHNILFEITFRSGSVKKVWAATISGALDSLGFGSHGLQLVKFWRERAEVRP